MSGFPLVSIIVPTRNSERFLALCLESIYAQTYPRIEVIVVDNYSTDNTVAIARNAGAKVLTCGPERSAQVNYGVRHSHGAVVYRVDSDFYLDPTIVAECAALTSNGFDAIVVHNSPLVRGRLSAIRKFEVDMYKFSLDHSAARFIRRTTYHSAGGYNESVTAGEDYDFQNRLMRIGARIGFCQAEAVHLDEPAAIWPVLVKFFRYGQDFANFRRANRPRRSIQLAFLRRDFVRNRRQFIVHPVLGMELALYHLSKYAAGGLGYSSSWFRRLL